MSSEDLCNPEKRKKGQIVAIEIEGKDTAFHVQLRQVTIFPERKFKSKKEKKRYTRMIRYVKKVYPYSLIISNIYKETAIALDTIETKSEKRKYLKRKEKELKSEFEDVIRSMTYTQGRILIKLVDRQTGHTSYEVIKQLKGSVSAILWQSIARIFSTNLKYEFDAKGDDKWIEEIVAKIENGQL